MSGRGRPLRFLALVAGGWIAMRVVLLWPSGGSFEDVLRAVAPMLAPNAEAAEAVLLEPQRPRAADRAAPVTAADPPSRRRSNPLRVQLSLLNTLTFGEAEYLDAPVGVYPAGGGGAGPVFPQWRDDPGPGRWSASAWLVMRPGSGLGAAPGGSQLGGSQAGVRLAYRLDPARRLSLYGRVTAPLEGQGREAAIGVEWQPTRAPLRLIAEERISIDSGEGAFGLGATGGTDRLPLAAGFRLDSYGQAGAVMRRRIEPYADGAARATRPIGEVGGVRLAVGGGAWGAAQRDAARLDLGPSALLTIPVARRELRVAIDWRQRVAGGARPGSGLALTLGADF